MFMACLFAQEWMSAFFSFVLYVTVLLRVRGNLTHDAAGKWALRWIPRSESWQLGFVRDYLDSCTVRLATIIVWYELYLLRLLFIQSRRFQVSCTCYATKVRDKSVEPEGAFLGDIHHAHRPNLSSALRELSWWRLRAARFHTRG